MKVRAGAITDCGGLLTEIASVVPSDTDLQKAVDLARVTRSPLARYLLRALEKAKRGDAEPEFVPNEDVEAVNLEHILPKNPQPNEWTQFTSDEKKAYLHRLGNLALLQKGPNDRIGNKPWMDKKPVLSNSSFELTKSAGANTNWTPTEVERRQKALAVLAVSAWPRTP